MSDALYGGTEADQERRKSAAIKERKGVVRSRNEKAKRLVSRLEGCDEDIASLLAQVADCLDTLITSPSPSDQTEAQETERRDVFEARAQEWFANLHDVQMSLRSAVKHLRNAQLPPVVHDTSSMTNATAGASTTSGSASRGHSLAILSHGYAASQELPIAPSLDEGLGGSSGYDDPIRSVPVPSSPSLPAFGEEAKLSLSALRLQHAGWKQLADSLQHLAASKTMTLGCHSERSAGRPASIGRSAQTLPSEEKQVLRSSVSELVDSKESGDLRLIGALLRLDLPDLATTA